MVHQTRVKKLLRQFELPSSLITLCQQIADIGGRAWLVGGCVRDMLLNHMPEDFDIEVYGVEVEHLEVLLNKLGKTESVGKQFGILKLWQEGLSIDIALPRIEHKVASGHCGFSIRSDPYLSPEQATLRRDFTINAMMIDPLSEALLDFHGGQEDLEKKRLRHISPAFGEDPLRPLRAMQFAARFQLTLDKDTAILCRQLLPEAASLPRSRIWGEWKKWALSQYPSYGMVALADSGWLSCYPELEAMIGCEQEACWHPEGDVWQHIMQVCDQAAMLASQKKLDSKTRQALLIAALCHDLGKPKASFVSDGGAIVSPGHAEAGVAVSQAFLQKIAAPGTLSELVTPLVKEHITHLHSDPTPRAVRRLAARLEPANIKLWEILVEADASGRKPAPASRPALGWLKLAEELDHQYRKPAAILTGKMLQKIGIKPGPEMGKILSDAYQAQLDGEIEDADSAIAWVRRERSAATDSH